MTIITAKVPEEITEVKVDSYKEDNFVETLILDKDSNFTCMYPEDGYTIKPKTKRGYEFVVDGTEVTYTKKIDDTQELLETLKKALEVLETKD